MDFRRPTVYRPRRGCDGFLHPDDYPPAELQLGRCADGVSPVSGTDGRPDGNGLRHDRTPGAAPSGHLPGTHPAGELGRDSPSAAHSGGGRQHSGGRTGGGVPQCFGSAVAAAGALPGRPALLRSAGYASWPGVSQMGQVRHTADGFSGYFRRRPGRLRRCDGV